MKIKYIGLTRNVDYKRRVILPKPIMDIVGLNPGEKVEIIAGTANGEKAIILKLLKEEK